MAAMRTTLQACEAKLLHDGAPDLLRRTFSRQWERLSRGESGFIAEADIEPVEDLPRLEDLPAADAAAADALARSVVIKLNGGLGTGMGLDRAKSLLPVRNGLSFLDLIAGQVLRLRRDIGSTVPLLCMNSFSTEADTLAALAAHPELGAGQPGLPLSFCQHRVPKLRAEDLAPVTWPADPEKEWCPPGHGDLYAAIQTSGLLPELLRQGFAYAFVSNSDNLGATPDLRILRHLATSRLPFLMEVTARTGADRKGGHLARRRGGGLLLRELAQCPPTDQDTFQDIARHRFFNTNNLWINLRALDDHLRGHSGVMDLPLIVNRKTVDPRDPASPAVVQLETAMGAAISLFPRAEALDVPRTRFAPVKTTDDLLALWSDAYELTDDARLVLAAGRRAPPVVRLDARFYRRIDDFTARFPKGAPSLLHAASLTVEGDVRFGPGVRVHGDATIRNSRAAAATLQDATASGELDL